MILITAYKKYFQNFTNFSGRSTRSEYWPVYLVNLFFTIILRVMIDYLPNFECISITILVIFVAPSFTLLVRRLHDIGKDGHEFLFIFIPIVGNIILLVYTLMKSDGDNQYGPAPKIESDQNEYYQPEQI